MPLQAKEWVYDLSGKVQIPIYQSVYLCPKCGTRVSDEGGNRYNKRKEEHKVSKDKYCFITSFDAQIKDGVRLTMDEYVEVTCKMCGYAWAEACADYKSPEVFIALDELFGFLPVLSEHVDAAFAAEAAEAEARAKESVALMKAGTVALSSNGDILRDVAKDVFFSVHDTRSQWEKESNVQPFSMETPEVQAQREVDALTPVLDTPEETVLPTKREMVLRRAWHAVDPHVKMLIPPVMLWVYLLWHIL